MLLGINLYKNKVTGCQTASTHEEDATKNRADKKNTNTAREENTRRTTLDSK